MLLRSLWLVVCVLGIVWGQPETRVAVDADKVFARMKQLGGRWEEKSSKGWTGGNQVRVIARASAVEFNSEFTDDADAGMATLVYMDKGRVLLTHYCEARNQPTLVASAMSPDGNTVWFTFLSATGIASRDDGHMDQVVLRFRSAGEYTSQWTWYAAGKERWMEEIAHRRVANEPRGHH